MNAIAKGDNLHSLDSFPLYRRRRRLLVFQVSLGVPTPINPIKDGCGCSPGATSGGLQIPHFAQNNEIVKDEQSQEKGL